MAAIIIFIFYSLLFCFFALVPAVTTETHQQIALKMEMCETVQEVPQQGWGEKGQMTKRCGQVGSLKLKVADAGTHFKS